MAVLRSLTLPLAALAGLALIGPPGPAHAASGFVMRWDALASAGSGAPPSNAAGLGMTVGQAVTGVAFDAGPAKVEAVGFWRGGVLGGHVTAVGPGRVDDLVLGLESVAPNPAVGAPLIRFTIPSAQRGGAAASLRVFDASGRLVRVLAAGGLEPGRHTLAWDRRNQAGGPVGPGVYFVSLNAGSTRLVRRVIVLR